MESGSSSSNVIPESVMEAVKRTEANIDELKTNLEEYLSYCDAETLSKLEPLEKAQTLLMIAKANTHLFALRLRCKGVDPDDHPVKKELERLSLYEEKVQKCLDSTKAPLRPSATVNPQAAARFIEHSLPHLSSEQKQSMREISRGANSRKNHVERNSQKKRKYPSSDKPSVKLAAKEFLQKAARELLGDNQNGVKGPFKPREDSDDDVVVLE